MYLSAQMVQSVPKISFFRASGYLRCLDSGRKYHHSGGQFAIRNDSAILCFRYHRGADDYYFPPLTGTYLRLSRTVIFFLTLFLTPLWLLFMQNPGWIPEWLAFIRVTDEIHVALIYQLLILEFAIDGLRLAAVNTPSMLTTPLSVIAGIVLGEYSVKSGWFNSETMLYMAFVTIANYSMTSFELGYALKFMRVLLLILTFFFNLWGFIAGTLIAVGCLVFNRTIAGKSYIYPLIPFHWSELKKRLLRNRLPHEEKNG